MSLLVDLALFVSTVRQQMKSLTPLTSQKVFTKEQFNRMDQQQRRFARQQLRVVFSREMSKISAAMSRRRQVSSNFSQMQEQSEQQMHRRMEKLNERMISVQLKRKKQLQKRIENCKLHDTDWQLRIKKLDDKLKQNNREATAKLRRFKEEYDEYLKSKKDKRDVKRKQEDQHNYHRHVHTEVVYHTLRPKTREARKNPSQYSHKGEIDVQIREHQIKSKMIKKEEEERLFQKALNKLETIKQRRSNINTKSKLSPNKALSDGSKNRRSVELESKQQSRGRDIKKFEIPNIFNYPKRSKTVTKTTDKRDIKQKIEQKEKQQRWSAFEQSLKKRKKEQILRTIKGKVAEFKLMAQRL